jgi:hypothetical protein
LEEVEEFIYLGSIVNIEGGTDADVKNRINKARVIFNILGKVWSAKNIARGTKMKIFNSNVNLCSYMGQTHGEQRVPALSILTVYLYARCFYVVLCFFCPVGSI